MARDFGQIYAEAPAPAVGRLTAFRQRYPYRHMEHGGMIYRVWDIDEAKNGEVIVFFPSGLGSGEIWFPYMLELTKKARLIALSFAQDETVSALIDGFLAVLGELGVDGAQTVTIAGVSVGGLLAQAFAADKKVHQHLSIKRLILAFTGTSCASLPQDMRAVWLKRRKLRLRLRFQNFGPMDKLNMAGALFRSVCPENMRESQRFWSAYFEDCFDQYVYKAQHIAINTALIPDVYDKRRFSGHDFPADMRTLILEASGDSNYSQAERQALRALFPDAVTADIGPNGQFSLQANEAECLSAISAFMQE